MPQNQAHDSVISEGKDASRSKKDRGETRDAHKTPDMVNRRLLFVSGKGGVGKSLVAAAVARREAQKGRRVLLVEIGDTSYFKDFFNLESVTYLPKSVAQHGFDLALWSGETCLREYILYYLKIERLFHVFFENNVMRALINVAPGLNEIAILGKLTSGIRRVGPEFTYDLIVIDCFATGHALALLEAPHGLTEAIKIGPMATQSREIDAVLRDPALTAYWVVTLLEEMPVVETLEFREKLKHALGVDCDIVANKFMQPLATDDALSAVARDQKGGLGEFARSILAVRERQMEFLNKLESSGARVDRVPLVFSNEADRLVQEAEGALRLA